MDLTIHLHCIAHALDFCFNFKNALSKFENNYDSLITESIFMDIQSNYKNDDLKLKNNENQKLLIHFQRIFHFYTSPENIEGFLMFSRGIEVEHWLKMA